MLSISKKTGWSCNNPHFNPETILKPCFRRIFEQKYEICLETNTVNLHIRGYNYLIRKQANQKPATLPAGTKLARMWQEENGLYYYRWTNQINDGIVWLRFEAVDNGDVESVSEIRWISIDSTKPVITNTRK